VLNCALRVAIAPNDENWSETYCISLLAARRYFDGSELPGSIQLRERDRFASVIDREEMQQAFQHFPPALQEMAYAEPPDMRLRVLLALVQHLNRASFDTVVLPQKRIGYFDPNELSLRDPTEQRGAPLQLDASTLANLEVLHPQDASSKGDTLLAHVDQCKSPLGHRMMRSWLAYPLTSVTAIEERLNAIDDLSSSDLLDVVRALRDGLQTIPDIDRMLSRLQAHTVKKSARAFFYTNQEAPIVKLFMDLIAGLRKAHALVSKMKPFSRTFRSRRLRHILEYQSPHVAAVSCNMRLCSQGLPLCLCLQRCFPRACDGEGCGERAAVRSSSVHCGWLSGASVEQRRSRSGDAARQGCRCPRGK
jgi:hypothetical protein